MEMKAPGEKGTAHSLQQPRRASCCVFKTGHCGFQIAVVFPPPAAFERVTRRVYWKVSVCIILQDSSSQQEVPEPGALGPPGNLTEMHVPRPGPGPTESETLCFSPPSGGSDPAAV